MNFFKIMNHNPDNDKLNYDQFQLDFLMKIEERMQLIRHRRMALDKGFWEIWHLMSNNN